MLWCSVEITYKKTVSERQVITFSVSSSDEPSNPRDTFADSSPRLLLFKVVLTINPRLNLFKSPPATKGNVLMKLSQIGLILFPLPLTHASQNNSIFFAIQDTRLEDGEWSGVCVCVFGGGDYL